MSDRVGSIAALALAVLVVAVALGALLALADAELSGIAAARNSERGDGVGRP